MSTEIFYCPIEVRAARMYDDPEPAEGCENEVEAEGDVCEYHDADAHYEAEYDDYAEAQREEARLEQEYGYED